MARHRHRPTSTPVRAALLTGLLAVLALLGLVSSHLVLAPTGSSSSAAAGGMRVGPRALDGSTVSPTATVTAVHRGAVAVTWVLDGVYVGRDTSAPFQLRLDTAPGDHELKARATARSGSRATYRASFTAAGPVDVPTAAAAAPTSAAGDAAPSTPAGSAAPSSEAPDSAAPAAPSTAVATTAPAPSSAATPAGPAATQVVHDTAQLTDAIESAAPGAVIQLADGRYAGRFTLSAAGTPGRPIVLRGGRGAVLDGGDTGSGYAVHLDGARFWQLQGFTVRGAQKGVVLDGSDSNVLTGLDVGSTGMEGVHLRGSSADNRIEGSVVHDTGLVEAGFGEGVYLGSAVSNWDTHGQHGGPDRSDRNVVTGNRIYAVTAEAIDVKEGTTGGVITGNTLDGSGMSGANYADSWIDVKGNDYRIEGNVGVDAVADGIQTHVQAPGWGRDNVVRGNTLTVRAGGYGVNVQGADPSSGNVVGCDNVVVGAGSGLSNIGCR